MSEIVKQESSDVISLEKLCESILPLPKDSVLIGMERDGLPVLYSVRSKESPNLIVWDRIIGQGIRLIKVAIEFILRYKTGHHTEFVVMSNRTKEWAKLSENGIGVWNRNECIAIVPFWDVVADQVLFALAGWIHERRPVKYPVILFIDGLENADRMGEDSKEWLRSIMLLGRKENIYVVACAQSKNRNELSHWFECFQAEAFGQDKVQWLELDRDKNTILFFTPDTVI